MLHTLYLAFMAGAFIFTFSFVLWVILLSVRS